MTWVTARRWVERGKYGRFEVGKTHWMSHPWVTLCGRPVDDDWFAGRWPSSGDLGLCAKCGKRGRRAS